MKNFYSFKNVIHTTYIEHMIVSNYIEILERFLCFGRSNRKFEFARIPKIKESILILSLNITNGEHLKINYHSSDTPKKLHFGKKLHLIHHYSAPI